MARRDADALAALTGPAVRLDFGGGAGVKETRQRLGDKEYKLWDEIAALLPLGCAELDGDSAMPWIYAKGPELEDPYSAMPALGPAVPAFAKPDASSSVAAMLNWAIVTVDAYQDPAKLFAKVNLRGGGKAAYVETARLHSLIDYRLIA